MKTIGENYQNLKLYCIIKLLINSVSKTININSLKYFNHISEVHLF
jgi:hypothetical protein